MKYKFCPNCGAPYSANQNISYLTCANCDYIFYQNSKPTSSVIIVKDNKILLGKRTQEPEKGKWDVIGGFLELGEDPETGAIREAKEETGLDIKIEKFLGIFMDTYSEDGYHTLNICYIGSLLGGQEKLDGEMSELKWFDRNEIPTDIAFKNGREMIALWKKQLK